MAERRMFAKSVIDSDAFLELPAKCQLLYFHLAMRADDDGFVNKAKTVLRMVGCTEEDLKRLVDAQYLISFPSGVVVIRHWNIHNYIKRDRYRETVHKEEKAMLGLTDNRVYTLLDPDWNQSGSSLEPQDRSGKERLGKVSSDQESTGGCAALEADPSFRPPTATEVMIYVKQNKYQVDPDRFVQFYHKNGWKERGNPMTDWKKAVDLWQQRKW